MTNIALPRRLHLLTGVDMWPAFDTMSKDGLVVALSGIAMGGVTGRGDGRGRGKGRGRG